jgi:hypothetical protein
VNEFRLSIQDNLSCLRRQVSRREKYRRLRPFDLDSRDQTKAVYVGHYQVRYNKVEVVLLEQYERFDSVRCFHDFVAFESKDLSEGTPRQGFVFN